MRSLSLLALCCFSPLLFAADVPGSQDLPIVPRMADAQIVDYRPVAELERIYPLGSIRKISGQLRFDGQVSCPRANHFGDLRVATGAFLHRGLHRRS